MFKGNKKYYYILAAIFVAVVVLQYIQPKPIDWSRTYLKNSKTPFGCYAIYNLLDDTYTTKIKNNSQTLYNLESQIKDADNTFLFIDNTVEFSKLDVASMFTLLNNGNTVFISAQNYGKTFSDTFHLKTQENWGFKNVSIDSLLTKRLFEIKYTQPKNNYLKKYTYPIVASESYFTNFDSTLFTVSSINKNNQAVLIEANIGKGKLIISSIPDVFGNLFIVDNTNRFYTYALLSKLKNNTIIWDEYYKTFNPKQKDVFQFIFQSDALYMAYGLLILGLIFFMLFEIKRKQRIIPIITPLQNSTLEFVDVISDVYFGSNNHKHIALESIIYFYFYLRKKFNISTTDFDDETYNTIHLLSGVKLDEVKKLISYCENLKTAPSLTQESLLELNNRITNFKQKSIR
jgi:hypothetical protein